MDFFENFPLLQNQNLLLREVTEEDFPYLQEITFYDGQSCHNLAEVAKIYEKIKTDYHKRESINWVICSKTDQKILGTCGFYRGFYQEKGEIGYIMLPKYRRKGIMFAAVKLILDFGFNELNLKVISAITALENYNSQNLLKKLGFQEIKTLDVKYLLFQKNIESS